MSPWIFCLVFWPLLLCTLLAPTLGFPMRSLGQVKNASRTLEYRKPVLCWVVQIYSSGYNLPRCASQGGGCGNDDPVELLEGRQKFTQHVQDVSSDLGLVAVHTFSQFSDHVLMCYRETGVNCKFYSPSKIENLHPATVKNVALFQQLKTAIEDRLSSHEEVLAFHLEYTHQHKSKIKILTGEAKDKATYNSSVAVQSKLWKFDSIFNTSRNTSEALSKLDQNQFLNFENHTNEIILQLLSRRWSPELEKNFCSLFKNNDCCSAFRFLLHIVFQSILNRGVHRSYHHPFLTAETHRLVKEYCDSLAKCPSGEKLCREIMDPSNIPSPLENVRDCLLFSTLQCICNHNLTVLTTDSNRSHIVSNCYQLFISVIKRNVQSRNAAKSPALWISRVICEESLKPIIQKNCNKLCQSILFHASSSSFPSKCQQFLKSYFFPADTKLTANGYRRKSLTQRRMISRKFPALKYGIPKNMRVERSVSRKSGILKSVRAERSGASGAPPPTTIYFNDPAFAKQWHLWNQATPTMDINVTGVWQKGFTGSGVTVAVVDDGLQWKNPDLKENYNYKGSWDLNDDDPDPTPSSSKEANHHGTRCAGEIAAVANNTVCGVGVAYGAMVSGIRVLDGTMTDSLEAEAFNKAMEVNDIYSCSWGPDDDGKTVDGPHLMAAKALRHGIEFGRHGYGSIFVVASGNGGVHRDNCNFDGYANSIYTVTIGAVDENGEMPYYAEECASMLGVTFSSGKANELDIVTTDWTVDNPSGCTDRHTGTSAAAPLAAGMIALMLQVRPCLTWRDVQYILILTAQKVDKQVAHWQRNGAGLSHSHKHGFGLLSAWRLVNAARVWKSVPWMTSFSSSLDLESHAGLGIPAGKSRQLLEVSLEVKEEDVRAYSLFILESVQVTVSLSHPCRGKLSIKLISPSKTVSVIAAPRPKDNSTSGFSSWTFTTVRCWGEGPTGLWKLTVHDTDTSAKETGKLTQWKLTLFGTPMSKEEFDDHRKRISEAMSGNFLDPNRTSPCPPAPKKMEEVAIFSEKTLKIFILCGIFCLVMALYESFEYFFCYDDEKKAYQQEVELAKRARRLTERTVRAVENEDFEMVAMTTASEPNSANASTGINSHHPMNVPEFIANDNNNSHTHYSLSQDFVNDDYSDDDDDDEEEDIFDSSETRRLLKSSLPSSPLSRWLRGPSPQSARVIANGATTPMSSTDNIRSTPFLQTSQSTADSSIASHPIPSLHRNQ